MIRTGTNRNRAVAVRPDGVAVELVVYDYGPGVLPHDLVHLAVERALGVEWGFWGLVAAGATLEALAETGAHGRPPAGDSGLLAAHVDDLLEAERLANGGWKEHPAAVAAVEALLAEWEAVPIDGKLRTSWPGPAASRS